MKKVLPVLVALASLAVASSVYACPYGQAVAVASGGCYSGGFQQQAFVQASPMFYQQQAFVQAAPMFYHPQVAVAAAPVYQQQAFVQVAAAPVHYGAQVNVAVAGRAKVRSGGAAVAVAASPGANVRVRSGRGLLGRQRTVVRVRN